MAAHPDFRTQVGTVAHESAHVAAHVLEAIGETARTDEVHAYLTGHVAVGGGHVIEALDRGIQLRGLGSYYGTHKLGVIKPRDHRTGTSATPEQRAEAIAAHYAWQSVRTGYGWGDVIGLRLRRLSIPAPRIGRQFLFCSEAACMAYRLTGLRLTEHTCGDLAPGDLAHLIDTEVDWTS